MAKSEDLIGEDEQESFEITRNHLRDELDYWSRQFEDEQFEHTDEVLSVVSLFTTLLRRMKQAHRNSDAEEISRLTQSTLPVHEAVGGEEFRKHFNERFAEELADRLVSHFQQKEGNG